MFCVLFRGWRDSARLCSQSGCLDVIEPVSIAGVPPVKLAPGSYVLRTVDTSGGARFVQVLSKRRDYVYTTVLAIPAERPYASDHPGIVFSESPSGVLPALHYWFPAGETLGYEFVTPASLPAVEQSGAPKQLQWRPEGNAHHAVANLEDSRDLTKSWLSSKMESLAPLAIGSGGTISSRRIAMAHLQRSCWLSSGLTGTRRGRRWTSYAG